MTTAAEWKELGLMLASAVLGVMSLRAALRMQSQRDITEREFRQWRARLDADEERKQGR